MPKLFKFLLFSFSLLSTIMVTAQNGINSPYSRFGIGDLNDNNLIHLRQMGGLSASFSDIYHINILNPASYADLRATSFDLGVASRYSNFEESSGNTNNVWSGNLEYLALAFPFRNPLNEAFEREKKKWRIGMGFSLLPVSTVAYNITTQDSIENIGAIQRNFSGRGGTWKAQWGTGFRYDNFSIGANLGYMYGNINYSRNLLFDDLSAAFNNNFATDLNLQGFVWNAGAMYQIRLNVQDLIDKKTTELKYISIGINGNSSTSFRTNVTNLDRNFLTVDNVQDTLRFTENVEGTGQLPAEIGVGATFHNGTKSAIGFNYSTTRWNQYRNDANPEELSDTYRISLGGFFRPNYKSFKFKDRVFYRYGVFYNTDPIANDQGQLKNYGLNFGFGLPFAYQRKISHLNLGFTLGRRSLSNALTENYLRIGLSFTFNDDEWFIRRKYN